MLKHLTMFLLEISVVSLFVPLNFEYIQFTEYIFVGSGFASNQMFLFGWIDMQIKLIPGRSAGTVVAYYVRKIS